MILRTGFCPVGSAERTTITTCFPKLLTRKKTMKKTFELKNATFTAEVGTASDVRALNDAQIDALVRNAMSNWSFRRGARKDSDGKNYDFAAVVADMLAVGERSSGPAKEDVALADELLHGAKGAGLPRDVAALLCGITTEEAKDAAVAALAAKWLPTEVVAMAIDAEAAAITNAEHVLPLVGVAVVHRAAKKFREANPGFDFTVDSDAPAKINAEEFCSARRRHIARKEKTTSLL